MITRKINWVAQERVDIPEIGSYDANQFQKHDFNPGAGLPVGSNDIGTVITRSAYDLSTATGEELEKIAQMYGIVRQQSAQPDSMGFGGTFTESDAELRHRIREFALGGSGGYVDPRTMGEFEIPDLRGKFLREVKEVCECGAAKTHGLTTRGSGHSSWCPLSK